MPELPEVETIVRGLERKSRAGLFLMYGLIQKKYLKIFLLIILLKK
jgi:formamidopyrimidine-DNA glycosylase